LGEPGQKIKIQTPNGDIWDDENGIEYKRSVTPNGYFIFWINPKYPGAKGVKITI
jgi:hypothetical protein